MSFCVLCRCGHFTAEEAGAQRGLVTSSWPHSPWGRGRYLKPGKLNRQGSLSVSFLSLMSLLETEARGRCRAQPGAWQANARGHASCERPQGWQSGRCLREGTAGIVSQVAPGRTQVAVRNGVNAARGHAGSLGSAFWERCAHTGATPRALVLVPPPGARPVAI